VWDWVVWGALSAGGLAGLVALVFLAVRVLQAWRDFKRMRRHVFRGLDRVSEAGERTAEKAAGLGETEELQASVGRLRRSLARLAILREAAGEAEAAAGRITAVVPRK
jgi:hypothetical protein